MTTKALLKTWVVDPLKATWAALDHAVNRAAYQVMLDSERREYAAKELGKAGIEDDTAIETVLNLAVIGSTSIPNAAEILASVSTVFKTRDYSHVADLLAAARNQTQGSLEDWYRALAQCSLVAEHLGHSLETTVGVLACLADKGYVGYEPGAELHTLILWYQPEDLAVFAGELKGRHQSMRTAVILAQAGPEGVREWVERVQVPGAAVEYVRRVKG